MPDARQDGDNPWRETVRDIYDALHFAPNNIAAQAVIALIEARHPHFFGVPDAPAAPPSQSDRAATYVRARYTDAGFPERRCDYCHRPYRGPAVYCSYACAVADA